MTDSVTFAKTMADETRQHIMRLLCCEWMCVSDIVDKTGVSQPTVSHHLGVLKSTGFVTARREGKQIFYTLNQNAIASCCGVLMQDFAPEVMESEE